MECGLRGVYLVALSGGPLFTVLSSADLPLQWPLEMWLSGPLHPYMGTLASTMKVLRKRLRV